MKMTGNSDIGRKRSRNEDNFCFGECAENVYYAVVCDGMGGASGGQIASGTACEIVEDKIKKCYNMNMTERSIENLLLSAITTANVSVYDRAVADMDLKGMGTTIVSAVIKDNNVCIAHVGDSRAYYITENGIKQITKDHSLVQQMLDNGQITRAEFETHPNKNIITRALGVGEEIEIDFDSITLSDDEAVLICTDGLSGLLTDEELYEIYRLVPFDKLVEVYIRAANERGGKDNITVVVMKNNT